MQEIEDISSEIEFLNNVELKIKKQLKQLSVEIHKVAITKLEKVYCLMLTSFKKLLLTFIKCFVFI